jgi:hypothetical protein
LSQDAHAYRLGGFGTHENIVYYYLVRFLVETAYDRRLGQSGLQESWERAAGGQVAGDAALEVAEETRVLEKLRDEWLRTPNEEFNGHIPAVTIERERRRLPEAVRAHEAMVDCDCPLCQMMADDRYGPTFWFLDGYGMDDDFAFSFHSTREEWEAEQRRWQEFNKRFDEEQAQQQADEPDVVWDQSASDADTAQLSPAVTLFSLGAHLAELIQNLKDAGAEQQVIDGLNHAFANLRDVEQNHDTALVEPVAQAMSELVADVAESRATLADDCEDLERQLLEFTGRLMAERSEVEGEEDDDDPPF